MARRLAKAKKSDPPFPAAPPVSASEGPAGKGIGKGIEESPEAQDERIPRKSVLGIPARRVWKLTASSSQVTGTWALVGTNCLIGRRMQDSKIWMAASMN